MLLSGTTHVGAVRGAASGAGPEVAFPAWRSTSWAIAPKAKRTTIPTTILSFHVIIFYPPKKPADLG